MKYIIATIITAIITFALFPELDLKVSSFFFYDQGFKYRHQFVLLFFYRFIYVLSTFITVLYLCLGAAKLLYKKFPIFTKPASLLSWPQLSFLFLALAIGPGLIVHQVIKPNWNRPRPVNVIEFQGTQDYVAPMVIGKQEGKSFISGHTAMGFYMVAFAFLYKGRKRKIYYALGFGFGAMMGTFRIAQGAHFLSDTVFGGLVSLLVIHVLNKLILERYEKIASSENSAIPPTHS